ncbi:MAG: hypothetical protein JWN95_3756 [Frankiales bacterium]|nr:hypothetical protein [Frankiales bacterium]
MRIGHTPQGFSVLTALVLAAGILLTGCTGTSHRLASTATPTTGLSSSATSAGGLGGGDGEQSSPAPRSTVVTTPTPKLSNIAGTEVAGDCPYVTTADFSLAEGDRIGRVVQLKGKPVGCRFYFAYDESAIVGEVLISVFKTPTAAFNAAVLSSHGHPEVQSDKTIGDGGAVAYRTMLQGTATWQAVFSKGTWVVTVRTRQPDPALNAFNLARVIAPKIP